MLVVFIATMNSFFIYFYFFGLFSILLPGHDTMWAENLVEVIRAKL
jgi:hypothetical protein